MMTAISVIENTFFANCRYWGNLNSSLYHCGPVWAMQTNIESADLNMVWNESPLTAEDGETIRIIKKRFRSAGLPFWWWVFPSAQSPATRALLHAEGFSLIENVPSLLAGLTSLPDAPPVNAHLQIMPVQNKEQLRLWEEVSFDGFDFPPETKKQYQRFLDALTLKKKTVQQLFLASFNDKPAATSLMFLHESAGGIYFVSTLPQYRKKGIGLAVTLATMRAAKKAGARCVTLQSSPDGLRVYRQAGFKEYCRADVYRLDKAE